MTSNSLPQTIYLKKTLCNWNRLSTTEIKKFGPIKKHFENNTHPNAHVIDGLFLLLIQIEKHFTKRIRQLKTKALVKYVKDLAHM